MTAWLGHEIPALLLERDKRNKATHRIYNDKVTHFATFEAVLGNESRLNLYLGKEVEGGNRIIPNIGTQVTVHVEGSSDLEGETSPGKPSFDGETSHKTKDERDFTTHAERPYDLRQVQPPRDAVYEVKTAFKDTDYDLQRKIQVIWKTYNRVRGDKFERRSTPRINGHPRAIFRVGTVIRGLIDPNYSPDWEREFLRKGSSEKIALYQAFKAKCLSVSNAKQSAFIRDALRGVPGCVAMLVGLSGSGKTQTLAWFKVLLMLIGKRVIGCAQSNGGANELLRKVLDLLESDERLYFLLDKVVRINRATLERKLSEEYRLRHMAKDDTANKYCLAARSASWLKANPKHRLAGDFEKHILAKNSRTKPPHNIPTFARTQTSIGAKSIENFQLIVCTTHVANTLYDDLGYHPSAMVIDEGSQMTMSYSLSAVTPYALGLVILAGDRNSLVQSRFLTPRKETHWKTC